MRGTFLTVGLICAALSSFIAANDSFNANEAAAMKSCREFEQAQRKYAESEGEYLFPMKRLYAADALCGAVTPPDPSALPRPSEAEKTKIDGLIEQLNDKNLAVCAQAHVELREFGGKAFEKVKARAMVEKDPYTLSRCIDILNLINGLYPPRLVPQGKHALWDRTTGRGFIDKAFAEAECCVGSDPEKITPRDGYLFRVLSSTVHFGLVSEFGKNRKAGWPAILLAFPKDYGSSGNKCFVITNTNTGDVIYYRDFGDKEKTDAFVKRCVEWNAEHEWSIVYDK
jgi:hypothetical protein